MSPSFCWLHRFGSFEIFKPVDSETGRQGPSVGRKDILEKMLNYTVETFYPEVSVFVDLPLWQFGLWLYMTFWPLIGTISLWPFHHSTSHFDFVTSDCEVLAFHFDLCTSPSQYFFKYNLYLMAIHTITMMLDSYFAHRY